jgi:hypothetical protein
MATLGLGLELGFLWFWDREIVRLSIRVSDREKKIILAAGFISIFCRESQSIRVRDRVGISHRESYVYILLEYLENI